MPALALRTLLLLLLAGYTAFAAGPFVWVATMSLRPTTEITADPSGLPWPMRWDKYGEAWPCQTSAGVVERRRTVEVP